MQLALSAHLGEKRNPGSGHKQAEEGKDARELSENGDAPRPHRLSNPGDRFVSSYVAFLEEEAQFEEKYA